MRQDRLHRTPLTMTGNEGKGTLGCAISLMLLVGLTLATIRVGPPYFAFKGFEAELKKEVSRAGANGLDDETIIRNVLDLARRNEIRMQKENIRVERFGANVTVIARYTTSLDLIFYQREITFETQSTSFVGRL